MLLRRRNGDEIMLKQFRNVLGTMLRLRENVEVT